jgi:hypothetical protein
MMGHVRILVNSAVTSHVTGTTANAANDVRCEVTLFRAVILSVANSTAVLTDLVFIVTKGTVQSGKFSKLITLVIVLAFRGRSSLEAM